MAVKSKKQYSLFRQMLFVPVHNEPLDRSVVPRRGMCLCEMLLTGAIRKEHTANLLMSARPLCQTDREDCSRYFQHTCQLILVPYISLSTTNGSADCQRNPSAIPQGVPYEKFNMYIIDTLFSMQPHLHWYVPLDRLPLRPSSHVPSFTRCQTRPRVR